MRSGSEVQNVTVVIGSKGVAWNVTAILGKRREVIGYTFCKGRTCEADVRKGDSVQTIGTQVMEGT